MTTSTVNSAAPGPFRRGLLDGLPFILTGAPFGLVFGILAAEAGMNVGQTMAMTILVIGGASQMTALAQMQLDAPVILTVAAGLLVNLRMAIYSAALAPHIGEAPLWKRALAAYMLVDNAYVTSIGDYTRHPGESISGKMVYFFATAIPVCIAWYISTLVGAVAGQAIPDSFALDFVVPIAFLAILAPLVRTLAHLAAISVSIVASLAFAPLPYNTELLVAAVLAMMAGAEVERRMGRPEGPLAPGGTAPPEERR